MVNTVFTLLALPALALCAPHPQHRHQHTRVHTDVVYTTVLTSATSTIVVSTPSTVASTSIDVVATPSTAASTSINVVPKPVFTGTSNLSASSGKIIFVNNCDYKVSVKPYPASGCSCGEGGDVAAGASWNDTLTDCSGGNTALKVYKEGASKPMQFEYGLDSNNVWYDMSFIDCMATGNDFSACAGGGWTMKSNDKCHAYSCTGGSTCCTQGYCDPYATGVDPAPNSACGPAQGYTDSSELGIVIELCGSS